MSKLPNSLRLEVARRSTNEIWNIDELLETIRKEIETREASDQVKLNDPKPLTFERTSKPGLFDSAGVTFEGQSGKYKNSMCLSRRTALFGFV